MTKRTLSVSVLRLCCCSAHLSGAAKTKQRQTIQRPEYTAGDDTGASVSIRLIDRSILICRNRSSGSAGAAFRAVHLYFTASILSGQDTYIDKDGNEVSYDTYSEGLFRFEPDSGECVQLVNYVDKPDVEDLDDGTQIFRSSNGSSPDPCPSRPAQTARSGSTAGQTFTRMTARWGPPFRSSSSWMRMARCFAPSSPQTRKIRTAQETGAIRTLTPCSPMIRAMSILTIIGPVNVYRAGWQLRFQQIR